jgi:subtilisin family serine protease
MKRFLLFTLLATLLIAVLGVSAAGAQGTGRYIVFSERSGAITSMMSSHARISGGNMVASLRGTNAVVVQSADRNFVARMRAMGYVVAPDRVVRNTEPAHIVSDSVTPSANSGLSNPRFPLQWYIDAVRAREGWVEGRRGAGAVVAVLDEGFYLNHPDLAPNFLSQYGASFVPGESVQWTAAPGFSHGTHVSGIIAAVDDNLGTVGVAPETKVVPIKVLSEQLGFGLDSWVIAGMLYASELRAFYDVPVSVINMSLGGLYETCDADCKATRRLYNQVVALIRQRGVSVFASAGNDAINFDMYPDALNLPSMANGVVAITATGPEGWASRTAADPRRPASYSNFGVRNADFASTGGDFNLFGTPEGDAPCTVIGLTRPCWVFDMVFSPSFVDGAGVFYSWAAGTSMAAPTATGLAAQIIGAQGLLGPAQLERELRRRAERLSPVNFYGQGFTRAKR